MPALSPLHFLGRILFSITVFQLPAAAVAETLDPKNKANPPSQNTTLQNRLANISKDAPLPQDQKQKLQEIAQEVTRRISELSLDVQKHVQRYEASTIFDYTALGKPGALEEWRKISREYLLSTEAFLAYEKSLPAWLEKRFESDNLPYGQSFVRGFLSTANFNIMHRRHQEAVALDDYVKLLETEREHWTIEGNDITSQDKAFVENLSKRIARLKEIDQQQTPQ